jgi:hypothetical protein
MSLPSKLITLHQLQELKMKVILLEQSQEKLNQLMKKVEISFMEPSN